MSFETWALRTFPRFMRGPWGTKFVTAVAGIVQRSEDAMREAVAARYVASAPDDALPYLAHDTRVPHFLAGDSTGELRERVGDAWSFHDKVGKEAGVDEVMEILGFFPPDTYVIDRSAGESWVHESGWWSTWWVVTANPSGWSLRGESFDDEEADGTTWETASGCWDVTADPSTFTQLHSYLWEYKWAHGVPAAVLMLFGTGDIWDVGLADGSTYNSRGSRTWEEVGGTATRLALRTCPLWDRDIREVNGDTYGNQTWDNASAEGQRWYGRLRPGS
jgi:hypothetical protein